MKKKLKKNKRPTTLDNKEWRVYYLKELYALLNTCTANELGRILDILYDEAKWN